MKQALEKKDLDLAAAQKEAREKTALADKKLASVGKLEEENSKLKAAVSDANREVERLNKDKDKLTNELGSLKARKGELESYLGQLAAKLVLKLEGTDDRLTYCGRLSSPIISSTHRLLNCAELCQDFEAETGRVETGLDPINCPVKDDVTMNVLRLESRMDSAVAYLARLKAAMTRVDAELWPQAELSQDLESLMARLNQIPDRVQEWKKSSARCGADVALSLVRVHCKDVKEDKLAELKVANTKRHTFQSFMDTFLDAATRIADSIDLDSFCDPASPSPDA